MTHINPTIPAVGDTNWGLPLNAALNGIVAQVNTLDDEVATLAANGGGGGGGGAISVVNNGDGTLTLGGNSVIDNGDGTFTVLDSFVEGGVGSGEPVGLSDATKATLAATYVAFKNYDGTPVTGKHVAITLTADGTDIDNIQVVTP